MVTYKFLLLLGTVLVHGSPYLEHNAIRSIDQNNEPSSEQAKPIYRLKDDIDVLLYELKILVDWENFSFNGTVIINVMAKYSTNKIELHSKNLKILNCQLTRGVRPMESKISFDQTQDLMIIESEQKLTYNTDYTLIIDYQGTLGDDMTGFYKSSYTLNGKEKWLAVTQFEPFYARQAFPCFDEPRFRASFIIHLARFANQKAISNMPSEQVSPPDPKIGNRVWEKFQKSPPMATYLVAFIISEFDHKADNEKKIAVWARENAVQYADYALQQGSKLLSELEGYTGIQYKLPKLDIVAVPDFRAGAMENWGLTTYRERYVLVEDPKTSSEFHKLIVTSVISHELAHQWFGDLVTPAWWDFLWLNEGFATYFEYFNLVGVEPSWKIDQLFIVEVVQNALHEEVQIQRAMTSQLNTLDDVRNAFDIISYEKAGSVLRMFEHVLTPSTFKACLHNYLQNGYEKRQGSVVPANLIDECEDQAYRDSSTKLPTKTLSEMMKTWTENIGFPLITVHRIYSNDTVQITQSVYNSIRAPKPPPEQEWIAPITYTTKHDLKFNDTKPNTWSFAKKPTVLPIIVPPADWIIVNIQQSGYYRVNYDDQNWNLIISQLHMAYEKIHFLNRAQLIDDSFALAEDDKISYRIPLMLIHYLAKENEYIPWYSAVTALDRLLSTYEATIAEPVLRNYLMPIIVQAFNQFGFGIKPTDEHLAKIVKPQFLSFACKLGLQQCVKQALDEYKTHKDDLSKIPSDLRKLVFCYNLREAKFEEGVMDNLWNYYLNSEISYEKTIVLSSFQCAKDSKITKSILSKLIDSKNKEIRSQDKSYITRLSFKRINFVSHAIEFVTDTMPTIGALDTEGLSTLKQILNSIASNVKTGEQIKQLQDLESKFKALDQKKYGEYTKIVQDAQSRGNFIINTNQKKGELFNTIVQELLSMKTSTVSPPTPTESSSTTLLVTSLWSLSLAGFSIYYALPALYIR